MRVLSASKREIFFKLRLYNSLPYLFSALRIAASMSVIGAVVGEWIGATAGVGAMIIQATYAFDSALLCRDRPVRGLVRQLLPDHHPGGALAHQMETSSRIERHVAQRPNTQNRWTRSPERWHPCPAGSAARARLDGARTPSDRHTFRNTAWRIDMTKIGDWLNGPPATHGSRRRRTWWWAAARRTVRRPGGGAQRRPDHPAGALQPFGRPGFRRHGAGAGRHVGQPSARDLGARQLPGHDRAHGGDGAGAFPLGRMGRGSRCVPALGPLGHL